jgi:hypothetical protein
MRSIPFAPLVQSYRKCRARALKMAYDTTGIAMGNMQLFLPLVVVAIVFCVHVYRRVVDIRVTTPYTKV